MRQASSASPWRTRVGGCSVCRARHIKCEGIEAGVLSCRACLKAGRTCDIESTEGSVWAIAPSVPRISRGQLEDVTFDKFANRFAPWLGKFTDEMFWMKSVLPAAQSNDSVFSAALAVTAFLEMPMKDGLPANEEEQTTYQTAITWYRKSVSASIGSVNGKQTAPDIALLLLTTVVYMNIEMRQGHYHNLHGLIRTAFALVYSAKTTLWNTKDPMILASLAQILEAGISLAIDSICVPRSHRNFTIVLLLKIAAEIGASEIDQLRFELFSIIYDVSDRCIAAENAQKETCCIIFSMGPCPALTANNHSSSGQEDFQFAGDTEALENRMRNWYARFVKYKADLDDPKESLSTLFRQQVMFFQTRAQWQAHVLSQQFDTDRTALEERFSALFEVFEELALDKPPVWITDMAIVPACLNMVWYLRDQAVLDRVTGIFKMYGMYKKNELMDNVLAYFETLVETDYRQPTELEQDLFGQTPTILKKWHIYMTVQHLLVKKKKALGI